MNKGGFLLPAKVSRTPNSKYNASGKQTKAVNNNTRGKKAEQKVMRKYKNNGYKVTRQGNAKGADFNATKNGRTVHVEVKVNTAVLKPKQKQMQKKHSSHYIVERVDMPTATTRKRKKK